MPHQNPKKLTLQALQEVVTGKAAAFRCQTRLQPAGGEGEKIFPPTYEGGVYATESRRIRKEDGSEEVVGCVLLDSVQSQANRMEEALLEAIRAGRLQLPLIEVDFSAADLLKPVANVTSLDAPHRLADAILRDSLLDDGTPFRTSEYARQWGAATLFNATPIYRLCPTALVFGLWGSPDNPGGLGAKFERTVVSEIVGIDCLSGERRLGFRIDPLDIRAKAKVIATEKGWTLSNDPGAKGAKSPSAVNHSNVGFNLPNAGVCCRLAQQTTVISLPAIRRLRFPLDGAKADPKVDRAAHLVLAALGLCAATLAAERGLNLRSRCLLWPTQPRVWEILDRPGEAPQPWALDGDRAIELVGEAVAAAEALGLRWRKEPLVLKPSPELVALVRRSQELAAAGSGEGETS